MSDPASNTPAAVDPHMPGLPIRVLLLDGGGCGGCALELEQLFLAGVLRELGFEPVDSPLQAELLLVTGSINRNLVPVVDAAWAAMPAPSWLITAGACAFDGGPFAVANGEPPNYAVAGGLNTRLPIALAIPGCPPTPEALRDGLSRFRDALRPPTARPRREPLPAALPRPPGDGDSSAG